MVPNGMQTADEVAAFRVHVAIDGRQFLSVHFCENLAQSRFAAAGFADQQDRLAKFLRFFHQHRGLAHVVRPDEVGEKMLVLVDLF